MSKFIRRAATKFEKMSSANQTVSSELPLRQPWRSATALWMERNPRRDHHHRTVIFICKMFIFRQITFLLRGPASATLFTFIVRPPKACLVNDFRPLAIRAQSITDFGEYRYRSSCILLNQIYLPPTLSSSALQKRLRIPDS